MRLGVLRDGRAVVINADEVAVDISDLLGIDSQSHAHELSAALGRYAEVREQINERLTDPKHVVVSASQAEWAPPSPRPRTVLAAPVNFHEHRGELGAKSPDQGRLDVRQLGLIVLASSSVTGPSGVVELPPLPDREFHFEGEIAVIIGKEAKGVSIDEAMETILGYTGAFDVTMRIEEDRKEDRSMRKSFHTFTPLGPYILTSDEVPDPSELGFETFVNSERKQVGHLADLIMGVPELVSYASSVIPLRPGDVIATGTPAGVGPIKAGDSLELRIPRLGELRMSVAQRSW